VIDPATNLETDRPITPLEGLLDGAASRGIELEPRFRVLATTAEPTPEELQGGGGDRRVQLLCHPVSTCLASLQRDRGGTKELLTFGRDHRVAVVAALDVPPIEGPVFGRIEPQPGAWGTHLSPEGRSTAPDERRMTATLVVCASELRSGPFVRCGDVELRDRSGESPEIPKAPREATAEPRGNR
jgi:hypothetical protein